MVGSSRRGTRGGARSCCLPVVVVSGACRGAGGGRLLTRMSMAGLRVSLTPEGCALAPSSAKPPSAAGPWTGFFSGFGVSMLEPAVSTRYFWSRSLSRRRNSVPKRRTISTGLPKTVEYIVLVCGDHEGFGGDTELLGEEACEDIAKIS